MSHPDGSRADPESIPTTSHEPTGEPAPILTWSKGLAPRYIAVYLLIIYFDQIAPRTLAVAGLVPSALGAIVGGALSFLLLFYPPAILGLRSRSSLEGIATRAFGARGVTWVPGLLLGLVHVLWFAVAIYYAVDLAFRALGSFGFLDVGHVEPWRMGGGLLCRPLFLWVSLAWLVASALIGTIAFRLTAAVMAGYQPFPALVVGALTVWALPGTPGFRPLGYDPVTAQHVTSPWWFSFSTMVQLVFAFSATFGIMGADWGAASRDEDDVRIGGLVGVGMASSVIAILALLIVAGVNGKPECLPRFSELIEAQRQLPRAEEGASPGLSLEAARHTIREGEAANYEVRQVVQAALPGNAGGAVLIILNLSLLGPACFTPFVIGRKIHQVFPILPRWGWSLVGAALAWPLVALRIPTRLELVFSILGAASAPVAGVLAATLLRSRTPPAISKENIQAAGFAAWVVGACAGLTLTFVEFAEIAQPSRIVPSSLLAFSLSFLIYLSLNLLSRDRGVRTPSPDLKSVAPGPEGQGTTVRGD